MFPTRRPTRILQADVASDNTTDVSIGDASDADYVAMRCDTDPPMSLTQPRTLDAANDAAVDATSAGCTGDLQCQGGTWRCDLNSHTCVPCLPGASDNCPTGQYCTAQFACVAGCKGNARAAAARAPTTNATIARTISSARPAMSAAPACALRLAPRRSPAAMASNAAGAIASALARDIHHCGGCPNACSSSQYCSSTGCTVVSIANICGNGQTTMLLNSYPADNDSNAVLQGGLTSQCAPPPTAGQIAQTSPGPINPSTGQPVAGGGNLLTVAGGFSFSAGQLPRLGRHHAGLPRAPRSDYWRYYRRGGGADAGPDGGASDAVVAEISWTDSTAARDIILIELVRDPASGTLALIVFGQHAESTAAAARYVATQMLPVANRSTYDKSWYVYDWRAASDAGPETFTLIASGL